LSKIHNLIILGSGPAGYSASIYAQRAGLNPVLISGLEIGGQLMQTTGVENYPGFETILGPQLMENMKSQVDKLGVITKTDYITKSDLSKYPYELKGQDETYLTKSLIIATGSSARWLGCVGEDTFRGFGVSSCATCDGFFFKNQAVAVIGGGNSALEEALYLSNIAKVVYLIHRKDTFRGEKIMQERVFATPNIKIIFNTIVEEMQGELSPQKTLKQLSLKNINTNETSILEVDGAFVAIGHTPNTGFLQKQLDLDSDGYIILNNNSTNVMQNGKILAGVFSAGDVSDKVYRQAITSAGSGCKSALDANHYLSTLKI